MDPAKDNRSEEYKLLATRLYNDYISLGSLEETAKKHGIPLSLAKEMVEDAASPSGASERPKRCRLSIPLEKLKEEYMKCLSLRMLAERYGVGIKAVSWAFRKHGIYISRLRREMSLKRIHDKYRELMQRLGRHPRRKDFSTYEGGNNLYHMILHYYGSLSNFRKAYMYPARERVRMATIYSEKETAPSKKPIKDIRALRAEEIYKDYLSLGTLRKVSQKHGLTPERIRQILKAGSDAGLFKYKPDKDAENKEKFSSFIMPDKLKEDFLHHGSMAAIAKHYGVPVVTVSQFVQKFNLSIKELRYERNKVKTHEDYEKLVKELGHHPTATELMRGIKTIPGLHNRILFYYGSLDDFRRMFGYPIPQKWYVKSVEKIKHRAEENRKNILHCIRIKPGITTPEIVDILGIAKEAIRLHLIKLEKGGIVEKTASRYKHYYYLKNPEAISFDDKKLKLSDLKTPLDPKEKLFIEKISRLYIKSGDFTAVAKKMHTDKTALLDRLDRTLESHALAPINNRYEFVLALRIKRIYDQVHNTIKTAKYFGVVEAVIDRYLRYGDTAGLFKRSESLAKHRDSKAIPKKEDLASKKNIKLIKKIKEEFGKTGSHRKIAQLHGASSETIRHILIMGNDLGLCEYPQRSKRLFARISRQDLYNSLLRYKSITKLSRHYYVDLYQVKEAIDKHGLSLPAIRIETHRQGVLESYQGLVKRLGHHPSTPEIKREYPYLIRAIQKWWGSVFIFRKAYGFPNAKMGRPC